MWVVLQGRARAQQHVSAARPASRNHADGLASRSSVASATACEMPSMLTQALPGAEAGYSPRGTVVYSTVLRKENIEVADSDPRTNERSILAKCTSSQRQHYCPLPLRNRHRLLKIEWPQRAVFQTAMETALKGKSPPTKWPLKTVAPHRLQRSCVLASRLKSQPPLQRPVSSQPCSLCSGLGFAAGARALSALPPCFIVKTPSNPHQSSAGSYIFLLHENPWHRPRLADDRLWRD